MNNNPLTVKEFKSILNHYDMNERDRDRLTAWHKQASETIEKTSSIDTIDFTPFLMDGVIHEGGHNTVDFKNNSNFKTINSLSNGIEGQPIDIEYVKQSIRNNIKKIIITQLNKCKSYSYITVLADDECFIANFSCYPLTNNYIVYKLLYGQCPELNKKFKSFANFDIVYSFRSRLNITMGIDVNALFYISNDVAIPGYNNSKAKLGDTSKHSNYLIHAHIAISSKLIEDFVNNNVDVLTDEYINNLPFISYVEISEIKKTPRLIETNINLPYTLIPSEITSINEHNIELDCTGIIVKPIGYYITDSDVHNINFAEIIYINPSDGKLYIMKIQNNQIAEIVEHQTT